MTPGLSRLFKYLLPDFVLDGCASPSSTSSFRFVSQVISIGDQWNEDAGPAGTTGRYGGKAVSKSIGRRLIRRRFESTRRGGNQRPHRNTATLVPPIVRSPVPAAPFSLPVQHGAGAAVRR